MIPFSEQDVGFARRASTQDAFPGAIPDLPSLS
jgi:hypothetical protein